MKRYPLITLNILMVAILFSFIIVGCGGSGGGGFIPNPVLTSTPVATSTPTFIVPSASETYIPAQQSGQLTLGNNAQVYVDTVEKSTTLKMEPTTLPATLPSDVTAAGLGYKISLSDNATFKTATIRLPISSGTGTAKIYHYNGSTYENLFGTESNGYIETKVDTNFSYVYVPIRVNSASPTSVPTSSAGRDWTYMVYMGADNNLSDAGLEDLAEMEQVGSNSNVAIVVQGEFSQKYSSNVPTDTLRFYVQKNTSGTSPNLNAGQSIGNVDMADPNNLTAFIKWAATNYPAKHYALVLWDHGAGWKERVLKSNVFKGAIQDGTSGTFMSLPDLAKGVRNSGVHCDIIDFDACLMAMYEVVYEFKGLCDYMVISEETEPGAGNPYDTILASLVASPTMSSKDLSITSVNKYYEYYLNTRDNTTLSSIDMSKVDTLDTKIRTLANALLDPSTTSIVQSARSSTQHYSYPENHDIYDFCSYLNTNLSGNAKAAASDILSFIPTIVVANKYTQGSTTGSVDKSYGIAIYLPTSSETSSSDLASYSLLACNQARGSASGTWGAYIDNLISGGGGGTATYGTGKFGVKIEWDEDSDVDLFVKEPMGDGTSEWFAPYMGQSSTNGTFSPDSSESGKSVEYYVAKNQVLVGNYYFAASYYEDGITSTSANIKVSIIDPENGIYNWRQITAQEVVNSSNRDWYIPKYYMVTKTTGSFYDGTISGSDKENYITFIYRKGNHR